LTDSSDDVVLLDLKVLSDLCEHAAIDIGTLNLKEEAKNQLTKMSPYLVKFAISLLQMFNENGSLLVERGVMIIRQLCLLLKPTEIFQSLSVLLQQEEDLDFVSEMVAHLNGILFTAPELFDLRERLRNRDEMGIRLFESLYRSWAFQPVSLIGLCLLARCYAHAAELAVLLSQIDVTVATLVELDRLVQLIESPLLAYVRLDLLHASHQRSIATVFSLLLMLLPQTEAFDHLHKRMQCLPAVCVAMEKSTETKEPVGIAFDKLKAQFLAINQRKRDFIRLKHEKLLQNS